MGRRKYVSGTQWCVWRWSDTDSEYLTRLHIFKTPWFALCLHFIHKPDPEPWVHDHPVTFLSLVLWGGYKELRQKVTQLVPRINTCNWWNWIRASDFDRHSIIDVKPHTLTLCFMGPKTRGWGFHTDQGWVHWKSYYRRQRRLKERMEWNPAVDVEWLQKEGDRGADRVAQ